MKKCEKCGWVTGNPADSFCEKCGGRLTEMPEKEAGDSQGKKGVLPIIAVCAAVAVLLIAGTVIGIRMMGEGKQEQTAQTAETETEKEPENSQTTLEEKEPDVQTEANSETQTQDVAGGAEKKSRIFRCLKLARRAPLRIRVRLQRRKNRHLPQQVMTFRK